MTAARWSAADWILVAVLAASAAGCAAAGRVWWQAAAERSSERTLHSDAASLVREVIHLRTLPRVILEEAPSTEHLGMVTDVLGRAGLGTSVIKRVVPEREAIVAAQAGQANLDMRSVSMRVELDGLLLPELGRFLASWRVLQPQWVATSITLSPRVTNSGAGGVLAIEEPRWTASLVLTCVYLGPTRTAKHEGLPHTSLAWSEEVEHGRRVWAKPDGRDAEDR